MDARRSATRQRPRIRAARRSAPCVDSGSRGRRAGGSRQRSADRVRATAHQGRSPARHAQPEPGQVPVRELGVGSVHQLKHREHVVMLLRCDSLGEHGDDRRLVGARTGREPECHRPKAVESPDRLALKCLTGERGDKLGKPRLILRGIGKQPALHRIADEGRDDGRDRPRPISSACPRYGESAHIGDPSQVPYQSPDRGFCAVLKRRDRVGCSLSLTVSELRT